MKNLTECQTIAEVEAYMEGRSQTFADARHEDIGEVNLALHQAALIGARLACEDLAQDFDEAVKVLEANGMGRENYWDINRAMTYAKRIRSRALDAAAIVKKGM